MALRFYRLQKISEGGIGLDQGEAETLKAPTEVATAGFAEQQLVFLSSLIDKVMNDKAFRTVASEQLLREVYDRLRRANPN